MISFTATPLYREDILTILIFGQKRRNMTYINCFPALKVSSFFLLGIKINIEKMNTLKDFGVNLI
jgi:hypothetical protein